MIVQKKKKNNRFQLYERQNGQFHEFIFYRPSIKFL